MNDWTYYQALATKRAGDIGMTLNFDEHGEQHRHEPPLRNHEHGPPFCCEHAKARWEFDRGARENELREGDEFELNSN